MAGHVIECGAQATGGNFSGFRALLDSGRADAPLGFPVAEIAADGSSVITKHDGTGGLVSVDTVTAQLVYEIQSTAYLGPDVTTHLDTIELAPAGPDRVAVSGVRGSAPPDTLKVCLNHLGGFRNQMELVLTGLDIDAKATWVRRQVEAAWSAAGTRFASVDWALARTDHPDAPTEEAASARLRVSVRDPDASTAGKTLHRPPRRARPGLLSRLHPHHAPGTGHPLRRLQGRLRPPHRRPPHRPPPRRHHRGHRAGRARAGPRPSPPRSPGPPVRPTTPSAPPSLQGGQSHPRSPRGPRRPRRCRAARRPPPASASRGQATCGRGGGAPLRDRGWAWPPRSEERAERVVGPGGGLRRRGRDPHPTATVPLGRLVHARSGDKGGDANLGLWVSQDDPKAGPRTEWLLGTVTPDWVRGLLPEAEGLEVEVFALPNLGGVNVLIRGLLGEGVAASSRFDPQAKGLGEWARSRHVDVPEELL